MNVVEVRKIDVKSRNILVESLGNAHELVYISRVWAGQAFKIDKLDNDDRHARSAVRLLGEVAKLLDACILTNGALDALAVGEIDI